MRCCTAGGATASSSIRGRGTGANRSPRTPPTTTATCSTGTRRAPAASGATTATSSAGKSRRRTDRLSTFGQRDGCSRGVAYDKGAMVFQMLATQDRAGELLAGDATLHRTVPGQVRHLGRHPAALRGDRRPESLDDFFTQWVHEAGSPELKVIDPGYDPAENAAAHLHPHSGRARL